MTTSRQASHKMDEVSVWQWAAIRQWWCVGVETAVTTKHSQSHIKTVLTWARFNIPFNAL